VRRDFFDSCQFKSVERLTLNIQPELNAQVAIARYRSFKRTGEMSVFGLKGETFEECELPDLDKFRPEAKRGLRERKFLWGAMTPERWTSPDRLVVKCETFFDTEEESGELSGEVSGKSRVLLRFGKDGKASVEKMLSRKVTGPAR
jgi:hypothetical protein